MTEIVDAEIIDNPVTRAEWDILNARVAAIYDFCEKMGNTMDALGSNPMFGSLLSASGIVL
jgi:hypothetical protein